MDLGEDTQEVVGVIVLHRNKILLVRGAGGKWSFPKGRRREKESPLQGAIREAREEAGIDLAGLSPDVTMLLRYGTYFLYSLKELPELAEPLTPEEVLEVGWKNYTSLKGHDKNADLRFYLRATNPKNLKHWC